MAETLKYGSHTIVRVGLTWAIDALASGFSSMDEKTESRGPSSFVKISRTVEKGMVGVASRHFWNSTTYSSGKSVGEEATNWPSFT
eukprot:1756263-Pyramimonas_sp.AAC.2